jgi:hypothetical protein
LIPQTAKEVNGHSLCSSSHQETSLNVSCGARFATAFLIVVKI